MINRAGANMRTFKPCYRELRLVIALALIYLTGCVSPEGRIDRLVQQYGFSREIVSGNSFQHVLYRPRSPGAGPELHVYIEGDGSPYIDRYFVRSDPTPRKPVALELMSKDAASTLYLGRPCYFGLAHTGACEPMYWTVKRFSPEVVSSLADVLRREISRANAHSVTLIGHSGGATLALLLADRVPQVDRVVTVAGNLDVGSWTQLHHFAPLVGSLDPAVEGFHDPHIKLYHYAGADDQNVPAALIVAAAQRLGGSVVVIPQFDHICCWADVWPRILRDLPAL